MYILQGPLPSTNIVSTTKTPRSSTSTIAIAGIANAIDSASPDVSAQKISPLAIAFPIMAIVIGALLVVALRKWKKSKPVEVRYKKDELIDSIRDKVELETFDNPMGMEEGEDAPLSPAIKI